MLLAEASSKRCHPNANRVRLLLVPEDRGHRPEYEACSRKVLIEAMGRALEGLTVSDACSFFKHRGYRAPGQLP